MFGGRDRPMPDYRGRDGMNMGPMGHMGPRPLDLPPMDMRRMDGPPMRGRDMDPREMRGREPNRDFFRPGEEQDLSLRRHYETSIRDKLMNSSSGFPGPVGIGDTDRYDMDMPPRERRMMDTDRRGGPPFNPRGGFDSDMDFRNRHGPAAEFRGKDVGFPRGDHFPAMDLPTIGSKPPQNHPHPEISPLTGPLGRENQNKHWLGERDPKHSQNKSNRDERPPYHKEKNQPAHEIQVPSDCFKGLKDIPHNQGPARGKMGSERDFESSSTVQTRDQDYRDIDYRTGSGRAFDYKREALQAPDKLIKESKPITPSKFSESGSQDQDYRSASVEDKVSNTISIIGIPKTATMEQILGAFAVRDGVPMQGMKIKNVVPGYSYDTAYVEFLNLEDAVHFMESNKGSLKVGTKTTSMKYIQPDEHERGVHESDNKVPQLQEPQLPRPDEPLEELKTNLNGSKPKGPMEPLPHSQWQRSSDLTPEAWQQQVDQQLQQQETEQQAEPWGNRNLPHHSSHQSDSVFKDSKTMIIKNVKPTTTVETILKALDPFAYLDERNVRLVKAKPPGAKCFCFVDMDSHEQVTRLVELLTKPRPLYIDGVRVYAEVAKPLKNQNFRRDFDKPNNSILGYPPETNMMGVSCSEIPDMTNYLYDATSGFFYDPETTLYYDPNSRKAPLLPPPGAAPPALVPGSAAASALEPVTTTGTPEKKDDDDPAKKDKEEKPRSLAAVKISGADDLFKKPLAPPKKDEKSKRPMGSLGLLASDYAATGSDEEVEEDKEDAAKSSQGGQFEDKDNKLTDWKKMACLLCRRQFPNKDALIRHQQLSDLHKQNMEIHLKIKRSKKELEALENQEKEVSDDCRENILWRVSGCHSITKGGMYSS
uniref:RNA-binding protein 6 n=1 Tax=Dicentrarchus labrax TaxID=13489 RepID=E6ZG72_DICLA|nr:RNA-binding protein 6 [Dicentrarchus labrax]